ncbi:hypothetical protein TU51_15780 [Bacillus cytotoxicus]|nr:hypothetical protein TU51_15780 [Bacillus cytotoxicus]
MSLNMYLGEVQNQTQSMNAVVLLPFKVWNKRSSRLTLLQSIRFYKDKHIVVQNHFLYKPFVL